MRFATWNLDWWQRNPERVPRQELLDQCNADVVALKEVRGSVRPQRWLGASYGPHLRVA